MNEYSINKKSTILAPLVGLLLVAPMVSAKINSGTYAIKAAHSGKCLEVSGADQEDGASVIQNSCNKNDNQLWNLTLQNDGQYLIKARHSSKCLDIVVDPKRPDKTASKANFADIIQWECNAGPMQSWNLSPVSEKSGLFTVKSDYANKCLDISGHSKEDRANLHQYNCHNAPNQQFTFVPTVIRSVATPEEAKTSETPNVNKTTTVSKFKVSKGDYSCPGGWRPASLDEVNANLAAVKSAPGLGEWHTARLACGGSQDGSGYKFANKAEDNRNLEHTLCVESSTPEICEGRSLSAKVHEHCDPKSKSYEYTQAEIAQMHWPKGLDRPSYVTLEPNTGMTVYSKSGLTGQSLTILESSNLCKLKYPDGSTVNDRVKSLKIYYVSK